MLDIRLVRENPELVRTALRSRRMETKPVDDLLNFDIQRRELLTKSETLKADRNRVSKEIGASRNATERALKIEAMRVVGDEISKLDEEITTIDAQLNEIIASIPNIPDSSVPDGDDSSANPVIKVVGEIPRFNFEPQPHWELGPKLGIIDFEQGVKITASRFYVLNGAGARLQRALIAWMLDLHIRQGYREKYTPFMVKGETLFASGQLPKFADNLYKDHEEDLYMVPTAEVPLTGIHMNDFIAADSLPLRYTAYTPCFRREKMSAGRDVRGIKRGHQFDKVEMYIFSKPDESMRELEKMIKDAEQTCLELGLTYRIVQQCTGDLGFNGRIAFDIEVWAPGCKEWLEVSSISNVWDFQARRANIKFKDAEGHKEFVHTLNGSGLGLPRTLIAVMETYQQADGSVRVPAVLKPWMGGIDVIQAE